MKTIPPFNRDTIPELLDRRAAARPDDIAYSFPDTGCACTWKELWGEVRRLAGAFLQLGAEKGERVALLMPGSIEMIACMYAAACIGAIVVPLHACSRKSELKAYLTDSRPTLMIIGVGADRQHDPAMMQELISDCWMSGEDNSWLPFAIYVLGDESEDIADPLRPFSELYELSRIAGEQPFYDASRSVNPSDPLVMLYTSGTSGTPKAVLRTTASFLPVSGERRQPGLAAHALTGLGGRAARFCTMLNLLPLFHASGFGMLLANLKACGMRIVMLGRFHPVSALAAAQRERCRLLVATPLMIRRLLACPERRDYALDKLLGVVFSSSSVTGALLEEVTRELKPMFFLVSYGSSEAGCVASATCFPGRRGMLPHRLLQLLLERTGLLGGAIPYGDFRDSPYSLAGRVDKRAEVRIADPQSGRTLPPREQGEIMIRSPRVMRYAKESLNRSGFTEDGWHRSGDLGFLDEKGRLTITGRLRRLISSGGETVSPMEIEDRLLRHPDVEQAFVLGVPDALYGEQACACIVARPGSGLTEEALRSALEPQPTDFKLPRCIFLPELPMSPTGKIAVADVRALAQERPGAPNAHA